MKEKENMPWSEVVEELKAETARRTPALVKTYWDIETEALPISEIQKFMPTEWPLGNLKDPVKIEQTKIEKREAWLEKAALSPLTASVLAIGIKDDAGFKILEGDEVDILTEFWALWKDHKRTFIGFNTHGFDFPFLVKRSWCWNIDIGFTLPDKLWSLRNSIDLMARWSFGDREERISLANLAEFLGLPPKTGSGKDFAPLWHTNKEAAIEYLQLDVELLEMAAKRMGV
jgi:hypothetical protein